MVLAQNSIYHARTEHIEIDHYFLRDLVMSNQMVIQFASSGDLADILIKVFPCSQFLTLQNTDGFASPSVCGVC